MTTPLDAILDIFILDYREQQKDIIKQDAKIWMAVSAWATLYGNMHSKGEAKEFQIKSIKDVIDESKTIKQIEQEKKDLIEWSSKADSLSKAFKDNKK